MSTFFALLPTDVALEIDLFSGGIGGDYANIKTHHLGGITPALNGDLIVMPSGEVLLSSGCQLLKFFLMGGGMAFLWQRQFRSRILGMYVCESSIIHLSCSDSEEFVDQQGYSEEFIAQQGGYKKLNCCDMRRKHTPYWDHTGKYLSFKAHELTIKKSQYFSPEHWRERYWKYPMPFHVRACCFLNSDIWVAGGPSDCIDCIIKMSR